MGIIRVCDLIARSHGTKAVLVMNDRPHCVDVRFIRKIHHYVRTRGAVVVGIYNRDTPEEWIMSDLESAGLA